MVKSTFLSTDEIAGMPVTSELPGTYDNIVKQSAKLQRWLFVLLYKNKLHYGQLNWLSLQLAEGGS